MWTWGTPERRDWYVLIQSLSCDGELLSFVGTIADKMPQVSCVKRGQGFDWNQELFLPSYADYESQDLEHRQDPVEEIIVTEEEIALMFPQ